MKKFFTFIFVGLMATSCTVSAMNLPGTLEKKRSYSRLSMLGKRKRTGEPGLQETKTSPTTPKKKKRKIAVTTELSNLRIRLLEYCTNGDITNLEALCLEVSDPDKKYYLFNTYFDCSNFKKSATHILYKVIIDEELNLVTKLNIIDLLIKNGSNISCLTKIRKTGNEEFTSCGQTIKQTFQNINTNKNRRYQHIKPLVLGTQTLAESIANTTIKYANRLIIQAINEANEMNGRPINPVDPVQRVLLF